MSTENSNVNGPEGTIPVNDAIEYATNWRKYLENSNSQFQARAFWVPIIDFQNILKYNPDADGIRIYIGLDNPDDPSTARALLVPTVKEEDVLYLYPDGNTGADGVESEGQSNTYDYTKTCPPYCNTSLMNP